MKPLPYYHVDVFSPKPLAGNGLIVFTEAGDLSAGVMQRLTQEMRQFESIFLQKTEGQQVRARIFTCEEELDFAGHPVLGAATVLHDLYKQKADTAEWTFELNSKIVTVLTWKNKEGYEAAMNQGKAEFGRVLDAAETTSILEYIDAVPDDLFPGLSPTVVSTGLPYLILPLRSNGFRTKIGAPGLKARLHAFGAQFLGLLDIETRSIRTGANDGSVEDIATGSLAGPACAFLVRHGLEMPDSRIRLEQGRNLSRDSILFTELRSCPGHSPDVWVSGSICKIASGTLESNWQSW
jgi:trans-2,3-dihydro-3-hydroxyanthranilate isomerase